MCGDDGNCTHVQNCSPSMFYKRSLFVCVHDLETNKKVIHVAQRLCRALRLCGTALQADNMAPRMTRSARVGDGLGLKN